MNKTAIILFADLPDFEARAKSFCNAVSQKATEKISSVLTNHFYQLANQTSANVLLVDTYQQKGKSFGEKIANAFAAVYAQGFDNVICIGNDCPDLDLLHLENTIAQVESGNVVLGPTLDGGAYLIGIPNQKFNLQNFQNIHWQTSRTFSNLKALFPQDVSTLEVLTDLDSESDFSFNKKSNPFTVCLINIIKSFIPIKKSSFNSIELVFLNVDGSFLKGPPVFSK